MPEYAAHEPGTFSWVELATTDAKAAVAFYRSLFGWDIDEHDMGPSGVYTIFTVRGHPVAAGAGQHPEERKMGVPPHWNLYVTVPNADQAAERAKSLGATLLDAPFDVMEQGRMAIIKDPTGAVLQLWQPKAHIGVGIRDEANSLCWSELTTRDPKAAEAFYTAMFGWSAKHSDNAGVGGYTEFSAGGRPQVGMMQMPADMPAQVPSYWMPYFMVDDVDAAAAKAASLGGTTMVGPVTIPDGGRFVLLQDPQQAMFALFQAARRS